MFKKSDHRETSEEDDRKPALMEPAPKTSGLARLRTYFLTRFVVAAPIAITIYLTYAFVTFVDANITPLIPARYNPETYLPFSVPGLGVLITAFALVLIGFLTANFLGRTLLTFGERIVSRMPVIRTIYHALKQIMETVMAQSSTSFREVVLVEYPRKGLWAVAFVTSQAKGEVDSLSDDDVISVFCAERRPQISRHAGGGGDQAGDIRRHDLARRHRRKSGRERQGDKKDQRTRKDAASTRQITDRRIPLKQIEEGPQRCTARRL